MSCPRMNHVLCFLPIDSFMDKREAMWKAKIDAKSEASVLWLFPISLDTGSTHHMDFSVTINILGFLGNWALDLRCLKTFKRSNCSNHMWNRKRVAVKQSRCFGHFSFF